MTVVDTNVVTERFGKGEEIRENITIVTAIEFPPVLTYKKFFGEIYTITPEDQILAVRIQIGKTQTHSRPPNSHHLHKSK